MYRIIGIIALVGTLAACQNPTTPQLSKTFEGEYKIILQSGPFRGPLNVRYGIKKKGSNDNDSLIITDASMLPWSVKKRDPVLRTAGRKHGVTIEVNYSRPSGFIPVIRETIYRMELWIDGTLKETVMMKIKNDDRNAFGILVAEP